MSESKLIKSQSPNVNCIYSLAIIVEGLSADLGLNIINKHACIMRSQVAVRREDFGDWSDGMEAAVLSLNYDKHTILDSCIELIYSISKKVEAAFRVREPRFDFYQRTEIDVMREHIAYPNSNCYRELKEIIYKRFILN